MIRPPIRPREDRPMRALVIMAGAVLLFTGIDTPAKWLMIAGLPALQVVLSAWVTMAKGTRPLP